MKMFKTDIQRMIHKTIFHFKQNSAFLLKLISLEMLEKNCMFKPFYWIHEKLF